VSNPVQDSAFPPIYPILPEEITGAEALKWAESLIRAGCRLLQFRRKLGRDDEALDDLRTIVEIAHASSCRVVVNDRLDLCMMAAADGLHVGQEDIPPSEARRVLGPEAVIGLSTHDEVRFMRALEEPIDYIALGPVFQTTSKEDASRVVPEPLQNKLTALSTLPVVAIGGITPSRARKLYERGFTSLAAIGAFGKEPAEAWRRFSGALTERKE